MNYNFQELYKKFEEIKSSKEYSDYCRDISDNSKIIDEIPFDEDKAEKQISVMTAKYGNELNWLAGVYGNGMTVVRTPPKKNAYQLKSNLLYVNNQISRKIFCIVRSVLKTNALRMWTFHP